MKKSRIKTRRPAKGGPVQVFTYGPFEFNVNRAQALAADSRKYQPQRRWPSREWVGPFIDIDEAAIEQADLDQPVLFATLITDGRPWYLLIDGNHRVLKALRHQSAVTTLTLDLPDTLKVIRGPAHAVEQMKRDGARLGLLPEKHQPPGAPGGSR